MQLGLLSVLLGLPNGALTGGQGNGGGQGAMADMFAQLLGDPGQGQGQYTPQGGALLTDVAPGSLVAQEVGTNDANDLTALNELLNQEISADDAQALLDQLELLSGEALSDATTADALANDAAADHAAGDLLQQLKAALTEIRDSKNAKTVSAVLTSLPALQTAAHNAAERTGAAERLLAWMKGALSASKQKDEAAEVADAADAAATPLTQSLQASMFRDADASTPAQEEEERSRDYIEIVPLNVTLEAAPAWIKKITDDVPAAAPEEIPGLELAENTKLPDVELPSTGPKGKDDKVTDLMQFRAMMEQGAAQKADQPAGAEAEATVSPLHAVGSSHAPQAAEHRGAVTLNTQNTHVNHAPVAEQVHVAVQRATKEGIDQLTISLEPADLGRVEVKMHTGADGQTQLSFVVDKAETLDSLARDARSLERMLQEAGVKTDAGTMQFNLRQQAQPDTQGQGQGNGRPNWENENDDVVGPQSAIPSIQNYTLTLRDGVDIRA